MSVLQAMGGPAPIFTKQKVNFQPTSPITHLVVANDQLVVALANKTLLRIDLRSPDQPHGTNRAPLSVCVLCMWRADLT